MTSKNKKIDSKKPSLISRMSLRGFGLASTNIMLGVFYLFFAFANLHSFLENPRLSVLVGILPFVVLIHTSNIAVVDEPLKPFRDIIHGFRYAPGRRRGDQTSRGYV